MLWSCVLFKETYKLKDLVSFFILRLSLHLKKYKNICIYLFIFLDF